MLKQRCKFFESETIKRLSREIVLFLRTWEIEGMIVGIPPLVLRLRRKQKKVKARPREQACGGLKTAKAAWQTSAHHHEPLWPHGENHLEVLQQCRVTLVP